MNEPHTVATDLHVNSEKLAGTIHTLCLRVGERFPNSGLLRVCNDLYAISLSAEQDVLAISRPNYALRAGVALFIAVVLATLLYTLSNLAVETRGLTLADLIQASESAAQDAIIIGAAVLFLTSIETRVKRHRVVGAINRLRSIAHVIDMHQLTKDPSAVLRGGPSTTHSPRREMTRFELNRYLDYCAEMVALVSKVGFLYVQDFPDPQAVNAVNDLEALTNGLSAKIWQKIMLLESAAEEAATNLLAELAQLQETE
jgi:hypothetical protein